MKVTAVVPAWNEEHTVGDVVRVLVGHPDVAEVIVVSDGSTDATAAVARMAGARVIELERNAGKGAAVKAGIDAAAGGDVLLLLDADLVGLRPDHVRRLLAPVLEGRADMTVGVFSGGRVATDLAQAATPFLSGNRAVLRRALEGITGLEAAGWGLEMILTRHARRQKLRVVRVGLDRLSQVMKEEKLGLARGLYRRLKMYWDVVRATR